MCDFLKLLTDRVQVHACRGARVTRILCTSMKTLCEGGVRVCGDAVLRDFWFGFAVIFILTRGIAVSKH